MADMANAIFGRGWALVGCAAILSFGGLACRGHQEPAFVQRAEGRRLLAQMRVDLAQASDASDRAVLADTDDASIQFARQARTATDAVAAALPQLATRLAERHAEQLTRLRDCLERYRQVDGQVLTLAVENTNLKAQRLSFVPVRQAADQFVASLDGAAAAAGTTPNCQVQREVARAALAVREIQVLQAPHIAEPNDAEMDRLEKAMAARRVTARAGLATLSSAAGPRARAALDAALKELDRFDQLTEQLIALSRQNTNVRSLQLALRQTPALTTACDQSLAALQDSLATEDFSGTR